MQTGSKFGGYEILSAIGKGGMGEVFRARDLQLKRDVALKVLPAALAGDLERMARFQREAELLASLNHPNIASIYGIAQEAASRALVMELVEGESPKGPLGWDEAWKICEQIAAALEYAHERGVVHRDLKPANVLVTSDGVVKLLDFGLAKALTGPTASSGDPENSPTLTMGATVVGTILGTAAYMAPEQAKGKTVDKRADIWAFGVVLWELLTGERLFKGEDVADTLAQVLTKEVDLARVPIAARRLIGECLQREQKARLRDIGDARRLIAREVRAEAGPVRSGKLGWAAAVVFAVAAGVALWAPWRSASPVTELRFLIPRPVASSVPFLSPDGQRVAFINDLGAITIRELDALEARDLPLARPTEAHVIWAPDSRSIVYQSRDYKLMKLALDGSPPVALANIPALNGGSWSEDGVILVSVRRGGLQRIPASGGTLSAATTLAKGQTEHLSPQFIGGGRFLYQATGDKAASGIYLASLTDPNGKVILPIADAAQNSLSFAYVPPLDGADSYILYTSQNVLLAQAVDPSSLELKGPAATIGQDAGTISASRNGAVVYGPSSGNQSSPEVHWVDRSGKEVATLAGAESGPDVTISPSGKRWARQKKGDIWLHDVAGGAPSRFTFEATDDRFFAWSPDDQWIAYATGGGRAHDRILRKNTVTSAAVETLVSGGTDLAITDWSRDGKYLLFAENGASTGKDLWTLDLQAKGAKPVPYLQTPAAESWSAFSPDGHWIAYQSDESGQTEIYVQSFPAGGGKFQVSIGGGIWPRWRADGQELFFLSGDSIVAVKIQTSPRFEASAQQTLFPANAGGGVRGGARNYDVAPDGNRFLVPKAAATGREVEPATIIINWQAGLKK